ncbi:MULTISPECIES: phage major capsid protein [unclassified Rhodococcus (in: high G+C Gram-positive bacteria)]|nr:phage major capsid protein [Rhodococcus sp. IEGM 1318]MDV8005039.1 phage major capsid protein [Rhodococcus sp. IEGM 1318]MDZ7910809.1 phage major capsid protein [Rhodococcus sp. (in: high G+C Gram-positive bacteria)]
MNLKEKRAAALANANAIVAGAKAAGVELTEEQSAAVATLVAEVETLDASIAKASEAAALLGKLDGLADESADATDGEEPAGEAPKAGRSSRKSVSLGDHFVKHAADAIKSRGGRFAIQAPEFKAATDSHVLTGWSAGTPYLTDFDQTIVQGYRPQLVIADLLGKGKISGNSITYLVEGAAEGDFAGVAEGGAKPQMHFVLPSSVTDALKKIAGWVKVSDELIEDAPFIKSEIDGRLLYKLGVFEEQQLLNGTGTGQNQLGLLKRSGIQTETSANIEDNADSVFRALTKISTGSGLVADGIVINPADYQNFRLSKDGNGQYFGGGYFAGQYGQGGIMENPPIWGLRTVVTPAIAAGTALVGAFGTAATLYRKGGVSVEAVNTHADDFTNNMVTIRAEERVALALRQPLGLVKLTLSSTPAA